MNVLDLWKSYAEFVDKKVRPDELHLAEAREYGVSFKSGVPVRFRFVRNTEKSPDFGPTYGQDIEPWGRFLLHNPDPGDLARGWESGEVSFEFPLVLKMVVEDEHVYGPNGWKARLVRASGGRKGKKLTCFLRKMGYDGIVTVDADDSTREIVDLRVVRCP